MSELRKFLRRDEVERLTGMPRSTIYDKMAKGEFPRAVKISGPGGRSVGWLEDEIAAWQADKIAKRIPFPALPAPETVAA